MFTQVASSFIQKVDSLLIRGINSLRNNIALAGDGTAGGAAGLETDKVTNGITSIMNYMKAGLALGGGIFIIIGGIQIATAVKSGEQNPEAVTGALKNILIGGILLGIDGLLVVFGA